jgi:hypothetical protein
MGADIVNLRRARKAKARAERERDAAENRRGFGRTRAERLTETAERQRAERHLDGHRRPDDGR